MKIRATIEPSRLALSLLAEAATRLRHRNELVILLSLSTATLRRIIVTIKDILRTHRTWEDGVGLLLGLTIGLSPWLYDEPTVPAVLVNSGLTGLVVLLLAQLELIRVRRWKEVAQLACGFWLSLSPFLRLLPSRPSSLLALGAGCACFDPRAFRAVARLE